MTQQTMTVVQALRTTLVVPDKVLKALNDSTQRDLDQLTSRVTADNRIPHDYRRHLDNLFDAIGLTWEVMRDAYSNDPGYEYPEVARRRELKQALRALNLAARFVTEFLKMSTIPDYFHSRFELADMALRISACCESKCSPGPKTYNHPQFSRWHRISAQCKRRIANIYLDDAAESDKKAELGPQPRSMS